ncbi:MAG: hypothetical protein EPN98_21550 [Phenylobacterium sp.]|uniref:hypothetical protein n=1 Tax=Phenylobacterium sp. TaxID=1871053 RepID=UPI00121638FC|nr:hypothetical protein [Phenylobacterium sp.]TAL29030.1 MAG: hypothetical protein EPN98_21550 [Phenylobacterium sp.]
MSTVVKIGNGADPIDFGGKGALHVASAGGVPTSGTNLADVTALTGGSLADGSIVFTVGGLLTGDSTTVKIDTTTKVVTFQTADSLSSHQVNIGHPSALFEIGRDNRSAQPTTGLLRFYGEQSSFDGFAFDGVGGLKVTIQPAGHVDIANLSAGGVVAAAVSTGRLAIAGNATALGAVSGTNTGDQTITLAGDVTGSGTGTFTATIASHAVTNSKFRQGVGLSVVGVSGSSTADVADITAGSNAQFLGRRSNALGFFGILNTDLPAATTNAVLFGRSGGGYDSDSVIVVDATNHRIGVNQTTPTHTVHVGGDVATSGDITVGNQLHVTDTSTLTGHVDANNGLAVNNAILTANATGTAFAVTAGNADLQHDAHVGGNLSVDGNVSVPSGHLTVNGNIETTAGGFIVGTTVILSSGATFPAGVICAGLNSSSDIVAGGDIILTGEIQFSVVDAPGAGASATLAQVGSPGPTSAAQTGWLRCRFSGNTIRIPYWQG